MIKDVVVHKRHWGKCRSGRITRNTEGASPALRNDHSPDGGRSARSSRCLTRARLPGPIVVCFGRFWVRGLPFPNARHLGHTFQWKNTLPWHLGPSPPKSECSASKIFRHSGITVAFKTTFEVFTRVGPDNSLERLTERSVGLVTDRPSDVYKLFVTPLQ
jgi:hypothetical protein